MNIDINCYTRKDGRFIQDYKSICKDTDLTNLTLVHLTFTLNPLMNKADILTQYKSMIHEIKTSNIFFYKINRKTSWTVHPGFHRLMLVAELTKTINIHLHGILLIDKKFTSYFFDEVRRMCWNSPILGRQHSFNPVNDDPKDRGRVADYAFKDLEVLNKFPVSEKIYNYKIEKII